MIRRFFFSAILILALAVPAAARELRVHAAASLSVVLRELGDQYEKKHGVKVVCNFGGSNLLARQIAEGVPGDLFLSADEKSMDELATRHLIVERSRRSFLGNRLVIILPSDSKNVVHSANDLAGPAFHRIALADPRGVPAGVYAREYLEKRGLWQALSARVIPTANVRAALLAVENGDADAAFVYASDAKGRQRVRVAVIIEDTKAPHITYPAAILRAAAEPLEAESFLAFLRSPTAKALFLQHGFLWK